MSLWTISQSDCSFQPIKVHHRHEIRHFGNLLWTEHSDSKNEFFSVNCAVLFDAFHSNTISERVLRLKKWNPGSPISKKALYHLKSVWKEFKKFIFQYTMENAFNWCATQAKKQRTNTRKRSSVLFFCFLKWRQIFNNFSINTALVFTPFFLGIIFSINQHGYWTLGEFLSQKVKLI